MTGNQLRRSMIASASGTMIEWFDFMLYAYLAPVMAPLFFPQAGLHAVDTAGQIAQFLGSITGNMGDFTRPDVLQGQTEVL